ncbi:hypothetical protein QWM81_10455 [Streptomyces ficellus]|uniref:L,D-transpeptidase n=1 Tax=Streptomyces ficellus TaxID=1977088 RepID=A0ABT7Z4N2_9ACTN|nr:hypothetical protein [Streptomyces ficellus]MDN3294464.1 hypothetical protein [Streptomyces ficellus]
MHARRLPTWAWVTGLTAGALATVATLAVQAGHAAPDGGRGAAAGPRPSVSPSSPSPAAGRSAAAPEAAAVPARSGEGRRIVYSLGQRRVWLVGEDNGVRRSFTVWPGSVAPAKGTHLVSFRRAAGTGSDGVGVENVVYFAVTSGVSVAFSNAVDGSSPAPVPGLRTGGIRMSAADGDAVWGFGTQGTTVSVVD